MKPVPKFLTRIILTAALAAGWLTQTLQAQSAAGKTALSLKDCISYAIQNHKSVANAKFDEFIASKKAKEFRAIGLPQVNGSIDFTDYEVFPTTVIPANAFNPFAPEDSLLAVQFGIRFNATATIQASQMIFDPSFFVGLKAMAKLEELSSLSTERTETEIAANVSTAYYTVLLNEERMKLLDINMERLNDVLKTTRALYENGFVEKIDADRLQITFDNLRMEKTKVERMVDLARDLLKFQMGMDINTDITLTDKIADAEQEFSSIQTTFSKNVNITNRIEYRLLNVQEELQSINYKRYKLSRIPSMFAFGSYSRQAIRPSIDFFDPDKQWYPSLIIGFKISVPLFDGLRTSSLIQQTGAEIKKIQNNKLMLEQAVGLEVRNAETRILNAYSDLQNLRSTRDLAEEVYNITKKKFEEGIGSNLEVIDAEGTLRESQTNYLTALYEYLLAKIDLAKAKGELTY